MRLWGSLCWLLGAMGANTSQVSDLSESQSIRTLIGPDAISENEPFWNQLISFTFTSPTCRWDAPPTPSLMSHTLTFIQMQTSHLAVKLCCFASEIDHLCEDPMSCLNVRAEGNVRSQWVFSVSQLICSKCCFSRANDCWVWVLHFKMQCAKNFPNQICN